MLLQFKPRRIASAVALCLGLSGPLYAANFDVTASTDNADETEPNTLSWAIRQANTTSCHSSCPNTITLKKNVTVTDVMLNLIDSDVILQSDGTVRTISGNKKFRPLFVKSGTVVIKNLNLVDGKAQGGSDILAGGGGAGLGGALFVYDGTVTLEKVGFKGNNATGGNGVWGGLGGGSGGGMYGDGSGAGGYIFGHGGGLFGSPYGGNGHYNGGPGAFGGGGYSSYRNQTDTGGSGGFGGGGGSGYSYDSTGHGGQGGFGGGGGSAYVNADYGDHAVGGDGGFGGGGGATWHGSAGQGGFGGGDGGPTAAGGGAGFGGAVFVKKGRVSLVDVSFSGNITVPGKGFQKGKAAGNDVYICTSDQGGDECAAVVYACGKTRTSEVGGGLLNTNCPAFFDINISGGNVDLGSPAVNTPVSRSFTIRNSGKATLDLTGPEYVSLSGAGCAPFNVAQQPVGAIAAGGSTTFSIAYNPVAATTSICTVSISHNGASTNPYTFEVSGQGFGLELANTEINSDWGSYTYPSGYVYSNPVLIVNPPSDNDGQAGVARLKNIGPTGFDLRFQPWDSLSDTSHGNEITSALVLEKGVHTLPDNSIWEVGTFPLQISNSGKNRSAVVPFKALFPKTPRVFLTVQTANDDNAVTVRAKSVNKKKFTAVLEEQTDNKLFDHGEETVAYLAVYNPPSKSKTPVTYSVYMNDDSEHEYQSQLINTTAQLMAIPSSSCQIKAQTDTAPISGVDKTKHPTQVLSISGADPFGQLAIKGKKTTALRLQCPGN